MLFRSTIPISISTGILSNYIYSSLSNVDKNKQPIKTIINEIEIIEITEDKITKTINRTKIYESNETISD